MSKFADLKKEKFINMASKYAEGKTKDTVEKITFSTTTEYIDILNDLSTKDRLSKSEIIRMSLLSFSRLEKLDREKLYDEVYLKNSK